MAEPLIRYKDVEVTTKTPGRRLSISTAASWFRETSTSTWKTYAICLIPTPIYTLYGSRNR